MRRWSLLGDLERPVLDCLWSAHEPQTAAQVHAALTTRRALAYNTVLTVLRRLAEKGLVAKDRRDRARTYTPVHGRHELVVGLMVEALEHATDFRSRQGALAHFVARLETGDTDTLRGALMEQMRRDKVH